MKRSILLLAALFYVGSALAAGSPECTTADKETWMSEDNFKNMASALGYQTDSMGVTEGNCYTLTKIDAASAEELDYFNPVTGEIVQ